MNHARYALVAASLAFAALSGSAAAQTAAETPPAITTPDKLQTPLGTLDFKDGAPTP